MATRRTHRQDFGDTPEYTGEFRDNTLPAKKQGMPLSAQERQRLIYVTGTENIEAEPDRRAFLGIGPYPDSVIDFED
jgi:hypothetical protein